MAITVYCYKTCSTCHKALKWLDTHDVAYEVIDIATKPPKKNDLKRALSGGLPLKKLFNTSGGSYRDGDWSEKLPRMSEAQALDALARDGMLVKRPFLLAGTDILVGFDESAYRTQFLKK